MIFVRFSTHEETLCWPEYSVLTEMEGLRESSAPALETDDLQGLVALPAHPAVLGSRRQTWHRQNFSNCIFRSTAGPPSNHRVRDGWSSMSQQLDLIRIMNQWFGEDIKHYDITSSCFSFKLWNISLRKVIHWVFQSFSRLYWLWYNCDQSLGLKP